MTIDEFLEKYNEYKKKYKISKTSFDERQLIRFEDDENKFCPLTLVLKEMTGKIVTILGWKEAGKELGLDKQDARTIMQAADALGENDIREKLLK